MARKIKTTKTADAAALEAVQQLGYAAAPVVVADGNHWSGFRPEKLDEIAGAA